MYIRAALIALALTSIAPGARAGGTMGSDVDALDFRILDVEYSASLERIVAVSATPSNRLHIYDPLAQSGVFVPLSLAPRCVSVSPDGLQALVGHDAWITVVDLQSASVVDTVPVSTVAVDIVHGGNGYAYVFPAADQWEYLHCVNLATEQETLSDGFLYAGTLGRLHPGGDWIYAADNGLSPSDIEKYSITGGTADYLYDSPYHGDYAMCGNLWFTEDGLRIITRCGNTFRASSIQSEDMTYAGALAGATAINWASHSAETHKIVVVPWFDPADRSIRIYDDAFLAFEEEVALPLWEVGGTDYPSHGRFVFHDSAGGRAFIVVAADPSSGLLLDSGIVTYTFEGGCAGSWANYCTSNPNSSGSAAQIEILGSMDISQNDAVMHATHCPPGKLGLFIFGAAQGLQPFGDGFLCLDMFASGLKRPWPALHVDGSGSAQQAIDFPNLPGHAYIPPGSTQNFQFWFRDPHGPGGGYFNLTNGASATFCD